MIDEMQVKNLALIKQASLVPAQGLTVLTGETGAGKTALLSALKLLMGSRADKDSVRDGQDGLEVSGRFFGLSLASSDGGEPREDEDELVAVRRVGADGRSRVTLDGRMASVRELAGTVSPSIDLCGQHDQQQLLKPAAHVGMLDASGRAGRGRGALRVSGGVRRGVAGGGGACPGPRCRSRLVGEAR